MKRTRAMSTTERDKRDFSNLKRRREKVKRNKKSDLKPKLGPLRTVLYFRSIIVILLPVDIVRS